MAALRDRLTALPGVVGVHDVHVWSLSDRMHAASVHVCVDGDPTLTAAREQSAAVKDVLHREFGIDHATVELETTTVSLPCADDAEACAPVERHLGEDRGRTGSGTIAVVTPTTAPVPIVLDVDTGVDDACALLLAARHPGLDLRAVTCVAGNADVDQVVHNTLTVLDAAGARRRAGRQGCRPPAAGAGPARAPRARRGRDGRPGLAPPSRHRPGDGHAVELLRDTLTSAVAHGEKLTLVPLAPLTNIALFLRTYPHAAAGLERIVFMGGSAGTGNATAAAEFNVWHDPDAAAVVLSACHELGIPVTMYGLDVFYDVTVSLEQARELSAGRSGTAADLAGRLVEFSCGRRQGSSATIGDAGAVCAVVDPGGLTTLGCRYGSSSPAPGPAAAPSSTPGRRPATWTTTRTGWPRRWSTSRSPSTASGTPSCGWPPCAEPPGDQLK